MQLRSYNSEKAHALQLQAAELMRQADEAELEHKEARVRAAEAAKPVNRYKAALSQLRKEHDFYTRVNVRSCCRSCASLGPKADEAEDAGRRILWNVQSSMNQSSVADDLHSGVLYVSHANLKPSDVHVLRGVFHEHGFNLEWDGSQSYALAVTDVA